MEQRYERDDQKIDWLESENRRLRSELQEKVLQIERLASSVDGLMNRATKAEEDLKESNRLYSELRKAAEMVIDETKERLAQEGIEMSMAPKSHYSHGMNALLSAMYGKPMEPRGKAVPLDEIIKDLEQKEKRNDEKKCCTDEDECAELGR